MTTIPPATQHVVPVTITHRGSQERDDGLEEDMFGTPSMTVQVHTSQTLSPTLYWTFFIYGFTFLLPWNAILVEVPYFITRIRGTGLEGSFTSYVLTITSLAVFVFLWHATITNSRPTASQRAIQSLLWTAFLNLKLLAMTFISMSPGVFAALVILNGIAQSAASAYMQTAFWAIGALFGSHAIQALSIGGAAVGVVVGAIQTISIYFSLIGQGGDSKPTIDETASGSAIILFGLTTLFLFGNVVLQWWLMNTKEYKDFVLSPDHSIPLEEMETLMSGRRDVPPEKMERGLTPKQMLTVNKAYNISIGYVFIISLALFPAVTGFVSSVNPDSTSVWTQPLLFNSVQFFLFNLGDFVSRYFPSMPALFVTSIRSLSIMAYARTVFIPLFFLCNIYPPNTPFINSDMIFMLLVFLLGLSNGYLSASIQICAASLEYNPKLRNRRIDVDTASTVIGFTLSLGLVIGGVVSFIAKAAICGTCNPLIEGG